MDKKVQKATRYLLYGSLVSALGGGAAVGILFKGPVAIGIFFGVILGFFLPWVVGLIGYSIYMMSNPAALFNDELQHYKHPQEKHKR